MITHSAPMFLQVGDSANSLMKPDTLPANPGMSLNEHPASTTKVILGCQVRFQKYKRLRVSKSRQPAGGVTFWQMPFLVSW